MVQSADQEAEATTGALNSAAILRLGLTFVLLMGAALLLSQDAVSAVALAS